MRAMSAISGVQQVGGKFHGLAVVALGLEAGAPRGQLPQPFAHRGEIGLRFGRIEPQQQRTGFDTRAVTDQQVADHAAARMLHLLHVRLDHQRAERDHRAGHMRHRAEHADAHRQKEPDQCDRRHVRADGGLRRPLAGAVGAGVDCDARGECGAQRGRLPAQLAEMHVEPGAVHGLPRR